MSLEQEKAAVIIAAAMREEFQAEAVKVAERQAAEASGDVAQVWQRIVKILRLSQPE